MAGFSIISVKIEEKRWNVSTSLYTRKAATLLWKNSYHWHMHTPKARLGALTFTDKTPPLLRVTRGNLADLKQGDTLRVLIPEVMQGKADVHIQGRSITLAGLSQSLQGKIITVIVLKTGKHPFLQLQQTQPQTTEVEQHSQPFRINIEQSHGKAFTVAFKSDPPAWLLHSKQTLSTIATEQHGKQITLRVLSPETMADNKSAKETGSAKISPLIHIESSTRSIQVGERFDIQFIASRNHGKPLLRLQPQSLSTVKHATSPALTLSVNEPIITEVKQRLASGRITFQWGNQSFETAAPEHVQVGDVLHLQVVKTGKKPTLNVLSHIPRAKEKATTIFHRNVGKTDSQQNVLNTIRRIASETPAIAKGGDTLPSANSTSPPLATALSDLNHWIDSYAIHANQPVDGSHIATVLRHLGQHYESSLLQYLNNSLQNLQNITQHDLKAILLKLIAASQNNDLASAAGRIAHAANQGVAHIESQQALNFIASLQQNSPARFDLPFIIQGQLHNVYVSIQQEQQNEHEHNDSHATEKQAYNVLFALNLTGLGALRIDASITDKSVNARFYHDNDAARQYVQKNIQRLVSKLEAIGYQRIYLGTASQHQMNHEKQTRFAQLLNNAPSSDRLLDIEV